KRRGRRGAASGRASIVRASRPRRKAATSFIRAFIGPAKHRGARIFRAIMMQPAAAAPVEPAAADSSWDDAADVVVVGSGSAGLRAPRTAGAGGARVTVLEKSPLLGGTSAMSGAGTWVPANHHMLAAGIADSKDAALTYLRATAPPGWQQEEDALWAAFVEAAPSMLAFLEAQTPLRFELVHHPDLYV